MNKKKVSGLIEKYNRGECSLREKELLAKYLDSFQISRNDWDENEMGNKLITEEKIYSVILNNINNKKAHSTESIFFSTTLLKRAASIIFFLILVSGFLYVSGVFRKQTDPVIWCEKITSAGEKCIMTLTDGSNVTLNSNSKLKYPEEFKGAIREVYLEGEAYFDISHNIKHPFIVHTENLSTRVLGTKFNITAYPDHKNILVALIEGKVKISRNEKGKTDNLVILTPKQELVYDKVDDISSFGLFDSIKAVGWINNTFKFENEPLSNVILQLEKAFGVKFKINNQSVLSQKITIKLEKCSLQTVVEVIKSLTGLKYKIVKGNNDNIKEVLFYGKTK